MAKTKDKSKVKPDLPNFTEIDGKLYVRIYYRDTSGKWRSKCKRVTSQREGNNEIARLRAQLCTAGPESFDGDRMLFDDLIVEYQKAYPDKPTRVVDAIKKYFQGRRLRSITYGDLVSFKASRAEVKDQRYRGEKRETVDRSLTSVNREMEQLRTIILFAVGHGWIIRNPFKTRPGSTPLILKSQEVKRKRIPTPEEEKALLAKCVDKRKHLRGLIIATLDTGLRRGALLALTWSCVDFKKAMLHIPPGNHIKKRPDIVAMTARLRAELLTLYEASDKEPATKVFKDIKDFKRSWNTACRLAGIVGLRFNDLRHGYRTALMEAGLPKDFAMKLAGHTNEDVDDIYVNVDERLAKQAAAVLDSLYRQREKAGPVPAAQQITEHNNLIN